MVFSGTCCYTCFFKCLRNFFFLSVPRAEKNVLERLGKLLPVLLCTLGVNIFSLVYKKKKNGKKKKEGYHTQKYRLEGVLLGRVLHK